MELFLSNPELDKQIAGIRRKIRLSMNGVVSENMVKHGIVYKQNYGVSIPQIRSIAAQYTPSHDLAQRLWALGIRETMILATLLQPIEKFDRKLADKWVNEVNQIEMSEQLCMNLFRKLPYANEFANELIDSTEQWKQITGFILASRIYEHLNDREIETFVNAGIEHSHTENLHLYKAIALCLSRIARRNKDSKQIVVQKISILSDSDNVGQKYIYHEVKEEILFLELL